nr:probable E3 ubiquitin-protein ligase RHY1A [Ipomoea batatas]
MESHVNFRPSIRSSFESSLCFGLGGPRTVVIIEVALKYKRWIFFRNRRGQVVDFYEINSHSYACFDSPGLSYSDLRARIRLWMPGMSRSLRNQLSHRIFVYAQQVALANARHRLNENGGANKVTAFVEIEEPQLQPSDNDQGQDFTGLRVDLEDHDGIILYFPNNFIDDDGGIVLYFSNNEESSKPPWGLSWDEINGLKQERFKNGTATEEESLMCSICLEEFSTGVKITPLPCSHTFHHNCIASWLQKHASCPLCRFDITQQCS